MARRSKYTPELVNRLCELIRAGNYACVACDVVGIHKDTYYQWINTKPDFSDAIKKAESEAETRNVVTIQKASQKNWQAAAWYLERKHGDRWGKREKEDKTDVSKLDELLVAMNKTANDTILQHQTSTEVSSATEALES